MGDILPTPTGCVPCDGASPACITGSVPIPGVPGNPGTPGGNGVNAFTTLTAGFVVPAASGTVTIAVGSTAWMAIGQIIFIQSAGYYQVATITDLTDAVVTNLNYTGNAVPTTSIASAQPVVPGGITGTSGAMGGGVTSVDLSAPSVFTVTGGPITTSGTLALTFATAQTQDRVLATPDGSAGAVALIALAPGHIPNLSATKITTDQIAIANGGTGQSSASTSFNALSPTNTKGDTIVFSGGGLGNVRVPVGTDTFVLVADSAQTAGLKWAASPKTPDTIQNASPLTGTNVTFTTVVTDITLYLTPAGTLASLSVNLPTDANSFIGQTCRIFCSQTLTALSVAAPSGSIVGTSVTALAQYTALVFQKVASSNVWIRLF